MRALLLLAALVAPMLWSRGDAEPPPPALPRPPAQTVAPWSQGYVGSGSSAARPLALILRGGVGPSDRLVFPPRQFPLLPVTPDLGRVGGVLRLRAGTSLTHSPYGDELPLTSAVEVPQAGVYAAGPAATGERVILEAPLAVNPSVPAPPALPQVGQAFLRLDGAGEGAVYRQSGNPLAYPVLNGRLLRLTRLEGDRAVFDVEGVGEVVREGAPGSGFDDLAPLVEDPDLKVLRARHEGKRVWGYGGLRGTCSPSPQTAVGWGGPPSASARVRHVFRLARPLNLNAQGGPGGDAARGADTLALTPLVFVLDQPQGVEVGGSVSASGADVPDPGDSDAFAAWLGQITTPASCGDAYTVYLPDTWAVERVFSLTAPSSAVPDPRPDDPRGLTRWQYAWLVGFPDASYGTRDTLLRARQWQYRNIPFPATVTFGPDGRVTDVDVPSLP